MAFKMKGSPVKMGGIQGTAGHTSALKQVDEKRKAAMEKDRKETERRAAMEKNDSEGDNRTAAQKKADETKYNQIVRRSNTDKALQMKSPMKQEYSWLNPDPDRQNIPSEPMSPEEIGEMYPEQYMRDQRLDWMNTMRSVDRKDYPIGTGGQAEYEAALKNESINLDDNYNYQIRELAKDEEDIKKRR